jgi:hypothetical protein
VFLKFLLAPGAREETSFVGFALQLYLKGAVYFALVKRQGLASGCVTTGPDGPCLGL